MSDLATLGIRFESQEAVTAEKRLDDVAGAADRAERATDELAASSRTTGGAIAQMAAQAEKAAKAQRAYTLVHSDAVKQTKALTQAGLGLSRQFADIGVTAAMGMNPIMILIQQGPQLVDVFQTAAAAGLGFKAVLAGLYAQIAPLVAAFLPWIAAVAAVSAGIYVLIRAHEQHKKKMEDLTKQIHDQTAELEKSVPSLIENANAAGLATEGAKNFEAWLDKNNATLATYADRLKTATVNQYMMAAAQAKATADNLKAENTRKTPRALVYTGGGGSDGLRTYLALQAEADANVRLADARAKAALNAPTSAFAQQQAKASSSNAQTVRTHAAAVDALAEAFAKSKAAVDQLIESLGRQVAVQGMGPEAVQIMEQQAEVSKAIAAGHLLEAATALRLIDALREMKTVREGVTVAANDNIKTMRDEIGDGPVFASGLDGLSSRLETAANKAYEARDAVDQIFYSIRNNDWTSALQGLVRVLGQVQAAFAKGATSASKFQAAAGVGQAAGSAIGGTAGATIGGAAGGAMAGFTVAGPVGAAIGAVLGGIAGFLGSSKAKKQAKAEAAAQAAQEAATKALQIANQKRELEINLMELQGKTAEALAARRSDELAAMDASNRALAEQTYVLMDAAEAAAKAAELAKTRRGLEIDLMDAQGKTSEALAARRADELAAMDESLRPLQQQIWAEQALTDEREKATAAAEAAARIEADRANLQISLMEAQGNAVGALALKRRQELDALDPSLRSIQNAIYAATDASARVSTARDALTQAYQRESSALEQTRDKFADFAKTLAEFRSSLDLTDAATGGQRYSAALSQFQATSASAQLGNADALSSLPSISQRFLDASKEYQGSSLDYQRDLAAVKRAVEAAQGTASRTASNADKQLDALNASVSGLVQVNESVISVADAIRDLKVALGLADAAGVTSVNGSADGLGQSGLYSPENMKKYNANLAAFMEAEAGKSDAQKAAERAATLAEGQAFLDKAWGGSYRGFATGGSGMVGGSGGPDSKLVSMRLSPGELVNVEHGSSAKGQAELIAALIEEVRGLRIETAKGTTASRKTADILTNVTRDGNALLTEAA